MAEKGLHYQRMFFNLLPQLQKSVQPCHSADLRMKAGRSMSVMILWQLKSQLSLRQRTPSLLLAEHAVVDSATIFHYHLESNSQRGHMPQSHITKVLSLTWRQPCWNSSSLYTCDWSCPSYLSTSGTLWALRLLFPHSSGHHHCPASGQQYLHSPITITSCYITNTIQLISCSAGFLILPAQSATNTFITIAPHQPTWWLRPYLAPLAPVMYAQCHQFHVALGNVIQ